MTAIQEAKALRLVCRMLDPDDLAFAVPPEVRDAARDVLGYARVETGQPGQPYIPQPRPESRNQRLLRPEVATATAGQPRLHSLVESLTNVAIGYTVALSSQLVIFPYYGIHVPLSSNVAIGLWFTFISIARSYCLRRAFNRNATISAGKKP